MDTGKGQFEMFEDQEEMSRRLVELKKAGTPTGGVFRLGEVVELKESRFKVVKITGRKLTLRLLPK